MNNINISPLAFYTSLGQQNHRKRYAFGEVFPLKVPNNILIPFQIVRETRINVLSSVLLKDLEGNTVADLKAAMEAQSLQINAFPDEGVDVIRYAANAPLGTSLAEGLHYLEMTDGVETWFSEVFTLINALESDPCHLKMEWYDNENFCYAGGLVDYSAGFKWWVYLPTELGRPAYEFTDEEQERDGFTFFEKQISEKTYRFNFLAAEYLLDALRLIRLSDNVEILSKGVAYDVEKILLSPEWQDGGYLANVEAEFQTDTILKKTGKGFTLPGLSGFDNSFDQNAFG